MAIGANRKPSLVAGESAGFALSNLDAEAPNDGAQAAS
jgi:hypothetical protein